MKQCHCFLDWHFHIPHPFLVVFLFRNSMQAIHVPCKPPSLAVNSIVSYYVAPYYGIATYQQVNIWERESITLPRVSFPGLPRVSFPCRAHPQSGNCLQSHSQDCLESHSHAGPHPQSGNCLQSHSQDTFPVWEQVLPLHTPESTESAHKFKGMSSLYLIC